MDYKCELNINNLKENIEIDKQGFYYFGDEKIEIPKATSKVISPNEDLGRNGFHYIEVECVQSTTIDAAIAEEGKCCILNFASYKTPGGGALKGWSSQEESLCYSSNLYSQLELMKGIFYDKHIREGMNNGLYSSEAIYSENISIIKNSKLRFIRPKTVNVITMAAPYAKTVRRYSPWLIPKIYQTLCSRCRRVLEIAASQGQETLILGAFGCGVFGNNIDDLIGIWYMLLSEPIGFYFKKVIFAVPDDSSFYKFKDTLDKMDVFGRRTFEDYECYDDDFGSYSYRKEEDVDDDDNFEEDECFDSLELEEESFEEDEYFDFEIEEGIEYLKPGCFVLSETQEYTEDMEDKSLDFFEKIKIEGVQSVTPFIANISIYSLYVEESKFLDFLENTEGYKIYKNQIIEKLNNYAEKGFNWLQIKQICNGLVGGFDISKYDNIELDDKEMGNILRYLMENGERKDTWLSHTIKILKGECK